jgi:hypothetical protein
MVIITNIQIMKLEIEFKCSNRIYCLQGIQENWITNPWTFPIIGQVHIIAF